jgi:hypothetical protein
VEFASFRGIAVRGNSPAVGDEDGGGVAEATGSEAGGGLV